VAAPTAGLHFTKELRNKMQGEGHSFRFTTLHVGAASFQSVWKEDAVELTKPAAELCEFSPGLLQDLQRNRQSGIPTVAVGTTVVRALESMARMEYSGADPVLAPTDLFIQPGFEFLSCDAVTTNFHQPRTTHMLLVEALLGRELLEHSYHFALQHDFRFLSYGDGMLIL
jgi:S-adenosylmethionine:tRNA ribosyltransferase-isomerase